MGDEKRQEVVEEFLTDAAAAGKAVEGYRAAPVAEEAFRTLADQLFELDRRDDLRQLVEAHRAGHPADPWLALYQADLQLTDKAWDDAIRVLSAALKTAPKELRDRLGWSYLQAMYGAGRWLEAYESAERRHETFAHLANLLANDKNVAGLEALIHAHRPHAADDADLYYFEARAKVLRKQPAEATTLFRKACQKQTEPTRRTGYVNQFLLDMDDIGQLLEAYRAAPDRSAAFPTAASRLLFQKKDQELATLLEEHARLGGADPLLDFYRGELHLLRRQAAQAEPHFAAALARATPREVWRFRDGFLRARVKMGQAVKTYREADTGPDTFESLASLCFQEKDANQLQALIDAHGPTPPGAPVLVSWELEVRWLKQDYAGALRLLTEHREDVFALARFRGKANDYRVRCLVRLKRAQDAVREAQAALRGRHANRRPLVLAWAATGDVRQTIAAVGKDPPSTYFLKGCYEDADLGPILRSNAFREFRAKFPEPKA
jgi:hypothetical protein